MRRAPLLPKLRGHFAEFLDNASPVGLRLPASSACVGLRYGSVGSHSGFSRRRHPPRRYSIFAPHRMPGSRGGICLPAASHACARLPSRAGLPAPRPHSSVPPEHRILHLFPIAYASPPRLRPRLTQGRSASPWKPRIFGRKDSHLPLATHSGILSPRRSTAPSGAASARRRCSPTGPCPCRHPAASV